jgi:hypothetical protein
MKHLHGYQLHMLQSILYIGNSAYVSEWMGMLWVSATPRCWPAKRRGLSFTLNNPENFSNDKKTHL